MVVYIVKAAENGSALEVVSANSAKLAMVQYRDALNRYNRAWVTDQFGTEIAIDDLTRLAQEEDGNA